MEIATTNKRVREKELNQIDFRITPMKKIKSKVDMAKFSSQPKGIPLYIALT